MIIAVLLATGAGWAVWRFLSAAPVTVILAKPNDFIVRQIKYQTFFLVVALVVAGLASVISTQGAHLVFSAGNLNAPVQAASFGPNRYAVSATWLQLGVLLTLLFGLATIALVLPSLKIVRHWPAFLRRFGGLIIVLAAINALSEELIYRGAIVAVAEGLLHALQTALLSAALFAVAHLRGQVNGVAVVAGSAIVGGCLCYAVLQTHGLFLAWWIHFIQDTVIFAAFVANSRDPLFHST